MILSNNKSNFADNLEQSNSGMKKLLVIVYVCFFLSPLSAQYYFNDIVSSINNQQNFALLLQHNIKKVTVQALENDNTASTDFFLTQTVNPAAKSLTTMSKSSFSDASILITKFDAQSRIVSVLDSADGGATNIQYSYNEAGKLYQMQSSSMQAAQAKNVVNEVRTYVYNSDGQPTTLYRVTGGRDTMIVHFILSDNGLPGEEQWIKANQKIETWYYYYDEDKRLTDIVRYNEAAKQMLPDYLFGYDENDRMTSKVAVQPVTSSYRIWQYRYDARGLKTQETVLNKQRQPEGKLIYTYE